MTLIHFTEEMIYVQGLSLIVSSNCYADEVLPVTQSFEYVALLRPYYTLPVFGQPTISALEFEFSVKSPSQARLGTIY